MQRILRFTIIILLHCLIWRPVGLHDHGDACELMPCQMVCQEIGDEVLSATCCYGRKLISSCHRSHQECKCHTCTCNGNKNTRHRKAIAKKQSSFTELSAPDMGRFAHMIHIRESPPTLLIQSLMAALVLPSKFVVRSQKKGILVSQNVETLSQLALCISCNTQSPKRSEKCRAHQQAQTLNIACAGT